MAKAKAKNIGKLREAGYHVSSVKEEMRRNIIQRIKKKEELLPGIVGYAESVIPHL